MIKKILTSLFFLYLIQIHAQDYADKRYYLIDSLNFDKLSVKDSTCIAINLESYHKTNNDSIQLLVLKKIIRGLKNSELKRKYTTTFLTAIEDKLTNNSIRLTSLTTKQLLTNKAYAFQIYGMIYKGKGELKKALDNYHIALKIRQQLPNKSSLGIQLNNIGALYESQGRHTKALEYFHKSLTIREKIADKKGIASCLNLIASVYKKQGNPKVALEYYHNSLSIREEILDKAGMSTSLNNIGVIYKNQKKFTKALAYYQRSLKLKEELGSKKGIAHLLNNIGTIHKEQGNLIIALKKYDKSLEMSTSLNDKKWMAITLFNMGSVFLKQNKTDKAYEFAKRSLEISTTIKQPGLIRDAAEVLKNVCYKQGNWKEAYSIQELFITMRDSIRNKNTEQNIKEQRTNYEVQKKEQEIALLKTEKEVQQLKLNKNRITNTIIIVVLLLGVFLAIFFYRVFKKNKKMYALLKNQNEEKKVMLKEIHHRVKNNLQVVNSLLRLQSKDIEDKEIVAKFKETQKRIISIASLHEKMYGSEDLGMINVKEHITSLIENTVESYALDKDIQLKIAIDNVLFGTKTLVPLVLIINEVISNSLKYAFIDRNGGELFIQIKKLESNAFEMIIGDNGVGKTANEKKGLGSRLIKIFAKQLNGSIEKLMQPGVVYKLIFEKIDHT